MLQAAFTKELIRLQEKTKSLLLQLAGSEPVNRVIARQPCRRGKSEVT